MAPLDRKFVYQLNYRKQIVSCQEESKQIVVPSELGVGDVKIYQTKLLELRTDRDLRQEDIAKVISCTKQAYGNYENGRRTLPLEQLIKLCEFYGVSADYILGLPKGLKYPER